MPALPVPVPVPVPVPAAVKILWKVLFSPASLPRFWPAAHSPLFTIPLAYLPALLQHEMKALPLALTLPLATLRENRKAQFFQEITTRDEVRKGKS